MISDRLKFIIAILLLLMLIGIVLIVLPGFRAYPSVEKEQPSTEAGFDECSIPGDYQANHGERNAGSSQSVSNYSCRILKEPEFHLNESHRGRNKRDHGAK
ncbi:MAG: hypothetical protein CVV41_10590 [Candidatus Riflebacteria bacterium HGW-Riflebacteria-1]|jgi:hypothetical protein|nr:MAG: hypothetical protein CVV41_10590 [Candidatus Riflebacteria bacterium HGW-Riflebacteria-1]